MATINKDELQADIVHAGEYGSVSRATRAKAVTAALGDVVHLVRLPANTQLQDLTLFHGAAGVGATVKAGYLPANSDNGAGDDAYFIASADVAAAGRKRADTAKGPVTLPYAVDIVVTATAAFASEAELTVSVEYEWRGR